MNGARQEPAPAEPVAALILAAGQSRRFGSDKRRVPIAGAENLLQRAIALAAAHCEQVFVAMRPDDAPLLEELLGDWAHDSRLVPLHAPRAAQGMGGSLADGLVEVRRREAVQGRNFSALLLMLADMPCIRASTVAAVVAARSMDRIVLPCYQDAGQMRSGHPVLFGRRWFDALSESSGDRGGRPVIDAHPECCHLLLTDDAGILRDVDHPEDLAQITGEGL